MEHKLNVESFGYKATIHMYESKVYFDHPNLYTVYLKSDILNTRLTDVFNQNDATLIFAIFKRWFKDKAEIMYKKQQKLLSSNSTG